MRVSTGSLKNDNGRYRILADSSETLSGSVISISHKDIRVIQLGKAALIAGIECLLASAGLITPEKIITVAAFGNHLDIQDLISLGIISAIEIKKPIVVGNAACTGTAMALCCERYVQEAQIIANNTEVVELANDPAFQDIFNSNLSF